MTVEGIKVTWESMRPQGGFSKIFSFTQPILIERLLCVRICAKYLMYSGKQSRYSSYPHGAGRPVEERDVKQIITYGHICVGRKIGQSFP